MGWANCGQDSQGRFIGYAHETTCDHPECDTKIDRGLSYACGGMHGEVGVSNGQGGDFCPTCEGYFCEKHRTMIEADFDGHVKVEGVCAACYKDVAKHVGLDDEDTVTGLSVQTNGGPKLSQASAECDGVSSPQGR